MPGDSAADRAGRVVDALIRIVRPQVVDWVAVALGQECEAVSDAEVSADELAHIQAQADRVRRRARQAESAAKRRSRTAQRIASSQGGDHGSEK